MKNVPFTLVSAWNNGNHHSSGAGCGIRFRRGDLETLFPEPGSIRLRIGEKGAEECTIRLSNSFWKGCPEIRDKRIGLWLINSGLGCWEKGRPPKLVFERRASHCVLRDFQRENTYAPLQDYLTLCGKHGVREVRLNFSDIERILRRALPESAFTRPAWWSRSPKAHVQAQAWTSAGYSPQVDWRERTVKFGFTG